MTETPYSTWKTKSVQPRPTIYTDMEFVDEGDDEWQLWKNQNRYYKNQADY